MKWLAFPASAALALALSVGTPGLGLAQAEIARQHLDDGLALAAEGDTAAALAELRKATDAAPQMAEAHYHLGFLLARSARTAAERHEAEKALLFAAALEPENRTYRRELTRLQESWLTNEGERVVERVQPPRYFFSPDSLVVIDSARAWQAEFEAFRRRGFPPRWGGFECDEQVGGVCLDYTQNAGWMLRHSAVLDTARDALLDRLAALADSLPGDEWIAGQRIRYMVEAGRFDDALALAKACGFARPWWCAALVGYVKHTAGQLEGADSAFAFAMREVPIRQKRWWTDISLFLDGALEEEYAASAGQQRDSLERRFWWLADPLYLTPVNDRWTEHVARGVISSLQVKAASGYGPYWGESLRQIVLRHGWPVGWVRSPVPRNQGFGRIVGVYTSRGRRFLPLPHFLRNPAAIRPGEWDIGSTAPPETYAPSYVRSFTTMEYQAAAFQRGDSVIVVVAYDQSADTAWLGAESEAGLFLVPNELSEGTALRRTGTQPSGVFVAAIESRPTLLSLELHSHSAQRAARVRYGLDLQPNPRFQLKLSELLVISHTDPLPVRLANAIPHTRGSLRVLPGDSLGLYWEVYGLGPDAETITVSLTAHKLGRGGLGQFEAVDLSEGPPVMTLSWQEVVPAYQSYWGRSIALDLPRDLSRGLYGLFLTVTARGREPVHATRALLVD